jgi:hypothetical protein
MSEAGCVLGSLSGWVGSGFIARSSLMLVGAAEGSDPRSLLGLPLRRRPCARTILHIERAREWELAQAACRLAFSPDGQPRGCYAARLGSKGLPLALLKATHVNGDVPRLAAARTRHKEGRE